MSELPKRKPTRLKNYDYRTVGYYFITICTHNREGLFSKIVGEGSEAALAVLNDSPGDCQIREWTEPQRDLAPPENQLFPFGKIAEQELCHLEKRYGNVKIDKYVIMPNHIHAIIVMKRQEQAPALRCRIWFVLLNR